MVFQLGEALEVLERTPTLLDAWLGGLSSPWLDCDEGPESFSPRDVMAHLVQGEEEDWLPRLRTVLRDGEAQAFEPFERFGFREQYADWDVPRLLVRFRELRTSNLAEVRGYELDAAALEQRGTHPDLGRVTLAQLLATWTAHDLAHLAQVARVMAKRYRDAVGPWREYMGVMDR